ncbi:MAG: FAD-dependent oxidoreductase [Thermodesulfobacteriota bacterium]
MMKVGVIGAGPAGLSCAYQLAKAGIKTDVYEASGHVGGLARSFDLWDQRVDLGPHRFFSKDPRVNRLWLEVVGRDYLMVDRLTRILYNNRFYRYPLQAVDVVTKLGAAEMSLCLLSYMRQKAAPTESGGEETFENWVVRRFGRRLFEIFFKTYSEKLWGIPCSELDADFAVQRIKKFSLFEALKAAVSTDKSGKHKTLVDRFAYPVEGTGMVYERMAAYVSEKGGNIYLKAPIKRVINTAREVKGIELMDGRTENYDKIVSTMPLPLLVLGLHGADTEAIASAKALKFRNTILVYLNVRNDNLFPDNWVYVHSPQMKVGRITNFRNWSPRLYGASSNSILALEYWCDESDAFWSWDDNKLIELGMKEINDTGLARAGDTSEGYVHRINRCYPVYMKGYKKLLKPIEKYLDGMKGLTVIGRYGAFKYNNQDHSILMGILAAENIVNGAENNLWATNTDYEYQESALITETGLVELNK